MKGSFRISAPQYLDCEVLIVGSGAGAACVADVLTKAGLDVLMVEEGPYTSAEDVSPKTSEAFLKNWRHGGLTAALGHPSVVYAEGRGVGGSTEINSAIIQKVDGELLDKWARSYSIDEFGERQLGPWYQRALSSIGTSLTQGPLGLPTDIIKRGADRMGWNAAPLERAQSHCVGTNACALVCPTGAKQSMSQTLLPAAIKRGMRLIAMCRVDRLHIKNGIAYGAVSHAQDYAGIKHRVEIRARDIFVCAGAINSPALLQRSGLKKNIGQSLRMHPTLRTISIFDHDINASENRLPLYAVKEFMPEQRIGGSVFSAPLFGMALAEDSANRADLLKDWKRAAIYYGMIRPEGVGRINGLLPGGDPLVRYNHGARDLHNIAEITFRLVQLLFAAGAKKVVPSIGGHTGWSSPTQANTELQDARLITRANLMTIHLFSSCPPGENAMAGTNSFGLVRETKNVFVADASQIPEAPGCNPQASVMAIALRNAEAYLARRPSNA